jgi:hypothetical protein
MFFLNVRDQVTVLKLILIRPIGHPHGSQHVTYCNRYAICNTILNRQASNQMTLCEICNLEVPISNMGEGSRYPNRFAWFLSVVSVECLEDIFNMSSFFQIPL